MLSKDLIELIKQIRKNGSEDNRIEIKKAAGGCPFFQSIRRRHYYFWYRSG